MSRARGFARQVIAAGVGYADIARDTGQSEGRLALTAIFNAVEDAGLSVSDVDGITAYPERVLSSFEGPPISYMQRTLGNDRTRYVQAFGSGATQLSAVTNAAYAIACGGAEVVVCVRAHRRQQGRHASRYATTGKTITGPVVYDVPFGVPSGCVALRPLGNSAHARVRDDGRTARRDRAHLPVERPAQPPSRLERNAVDDGVVPGVRPRRVAVSAPRLRLPC